MVCPYHWTLTSVALLLFSVRFVSGGTDASDRVAAEVSASGEIDSSGESGECSADGCGNVNSAQLFEWFRSRGGTAEGIELHGISSSERGLVATEDLPEGTKIITVPVGLTVTMQRTTATPLGQKLLEAAGEGRAPDMKSFDGVLLAAWILHERSQSGSEWSVYVKSLPDSFTTPFNFTDAEVKACLGGLSAESYIERGKGLLEKEISLVQSLQEDSATKFSSSSYLWARFMSFSRTFTVDRARLNMDSTMTGLPELPALAKKLWADSKETNEAAIFVPVADMLNHAQFPNCDWSYSGRRGFTVITRRPVAKGEELLINYGVKENQLWLAHYGFVEPGTPGDKWDMTLQLGDLEGSKAGGDQAHEPVKVKLRIDAANPSAPEELQELMDACRDRAHALLGSEGDKPAELEAAALRLLIASITREEQSFAAGPECPSICRAFRENLQGLVATWRVFAERALALVAGTEPPVEGSLKVKRFARYSRLYFGLWLNGQGGARLAKSKDDAKAAKPYGQMSFFDAVYTED